MATRRRRAYCTDAGARPGARIGLSPRGARPGVRHDLRVSAIRAGVPVRTTAVRKA